jgi:calcineurin-like phosphoesterase family protein
MTLRIHIISDLHNEHGRCSLPKVNCDLVVVAGDLANGRHMAKTLREISKQLTSPAIYVPGNHDWYNFDILNDRKSLLRAWQQASPVLILDDATWRLSHGDTSYRFIGSTWWSAMDWTEDGRRGSDAFAVVSELAAGSINDFQMISHDGRCFQPEDAAELHHLSTQFLVRQIAEATSAGEVPIVITHFLPSAMSCHSEYRGSLLNAYFANTCDDLTVGVPLWIHGHTHKSFDYTLPSGCRVICNPRGYAQENKDFSPSLVATLP